MSNRPKAGTIVWTDLTVNDAAPLADFYSNVVGWKQNAADMGGYNDFFMLSPETGENAAGVCHARGANADLPPYWLIYIAVDNIEARMKRCASAGGKVIVGVKSLGEMGRYCVLQDPAGAYFALLDHSQVRSRGPR